MQFWGPFRRTPNLPVSCDGSSLPPHACLTCHGNELLVRKFIEFSGWNSLVGERVHTSADHSAIMERRAAVPALSKTSQNVISRERQAVGLSTEVRHLVSLLDTQVEAKLRTFLAPILTELSEVRKAIHLQQLQCQVISAEGQIMVLLLSPL